MLFFLIILLIFIFSRVGLQQQAGTTEPGSAELLHFQGNLREIPVSALLQAVCVFEQKPQTDLSIIISRLRPVESEQGETFGC